jgi:hypothetical protein
MRDQGTPSWFGSAARDLLLRKDGHGSELLFSDRTECEWQGGQAMSRADTPLLWALRDTLQLTGTKYGCGQALCGACTVHVDGADALLRDAGVGVAGRKITTIEAVDAGRSARPCRRPGASSTWCSAATASPARS